MLKTTQHIPTISQFHITTLGVHKLLSEINSLCKHFHTSDQRNCRGYICTGIHRNVYQCTGCTLKCILGKWLHFKRSSHYHQSKDCLDVEASSLLILYRPRSKLIVGLSFILVAKFDCGIEYQHEAVI